MMLIDIACSQIPNHKTKHKYKNYRIQHIYVGCPFRSSIWHLYLIYSFFGTPVFFTHAHLGLQDLHLPRFVALGHENDGMCRFGWNFFRLLFGSLKLLQLQPEESQRSLDQCILPGEEGIDRFTCWPCLFHHQTVFLQDVSPEMFTEMWCNGWQADSLTQKELFDHLCMHIAIGQDTVLRTKILQVIPNATQGIGEKHLSVGCMCIFKTNADLVAEDFIQKGEVTRAHLGQTSDSIFCPGLQSGEAQNCFATTFGWKVGILQSIATICTRNASSISTVSGNGFLQRQKVPFGLGHLFTIHHDMTVAIEGPRP